MIDGFWGNIAAPLIFMAVLGASPWELLTMPGTVSLKGLSTYRDRCRASCPEVCGELAGYLDGFLCGIIFGAAAGFFGISGYTIPLFFAIPVICAIFLPWRHPGKSFFPTMVAGTFIILAPEESFIAIPLVLTFALTFYPIILLPGMALVLSVFILSIIRDKSIFAFTATVLTVFSFFCLNGHMAAFEIRTIKDRLDGHLVRRKIYRYCGLIPPLVIYPLCGPTILRTVLVCLACTSLTLECTRRILPGLDDFLKKLFNPVEKETKTAYLSGTTAYLLGSAVASFFPGAIGPLALIMATLGDAWAVLAGSRSGNHIWINGKSAEGSSACLFISFISAFSVASTCFPFRIGRFAILPASVALTIVEGLTRGAWDNLLMAPVASTVMYLLE